MGLFPNTWIAGCSCAENAENVFGRYVTAIWQEAHRHLVSGHVRAVMHAGIANPRWRGKRSRHSKLYYTFNQIIYYEIWWFIYDVNIWQIWYWIYTLIFFKVLLPNKHEFMRRIVNNCLNQLRSTSPTCTQHLRRYCLCPFPTLIHSSALNIFIPNCCNICGAETEIF